MTENLNQDSNSTGLRMAIEASPGVLPVTPVWFPLEPNNYRDFGAEYTKVARNPINASRQRSKGVIVDQNANGGYQEDLTYGNSQKFMPGVTMSAFRTKSEKIVTTVDDVNGYTITGGGYAVGDLLFAKGFDIAANNGLKSVTAATATEIDVAGVFDETGATGVISRVGFEFAAADAEIDTSGALPALITTTKDLTELGLTPGEWVYIGGDNAANQFATSANNGYARVRSIAENEITFDKTEAPLVTDAGAGKSIRLYFGRFIKNENDPALITKVSVQIERTLGRADTTDTYEQREYLEDSYFNTFSLTWNTADKITYDVGLLAGNYETYDGETAPKDGIRPVGTEDDAFNTSNNVRRAQLGIVGTPTPLFGYLSEISAQINNNVRPNKAISRVGAFSHSLGSFAVDLTFTAYFANVAAVAAIKNNEDVTFDIILAQDNQAIVYDWPLGSLGDGRLRVQANESITLPLSMDAARARKIDPNLDYTFGATFFDYLPEAAM